MRVWDSVRHAQAQGLARRIQSAAELRSRHRAWEFAICSQDDWVVGSSVIWGQHSGAGDQFRGRPVLARAGARALE